jgi:alkylhydroperoxidase family enzyme
VAHTAIDDAFFDELHAHFTDAEILDLTICIAAFVALGRTLNVLGIEDTSLTDVTYPSKA